MRYVQYYDDVNGAALLPFPIKVLVNFNFNGTVIFGNSINVKNIQYISIGQYKVNFITPVDNINYSIFVSGTADDSSLTVWGGEVGTYLERSINSTTIQMVNAVGAVNPSLTSVFIVSNF